MWTPATPVLSHAGPLLPLGVADSLGLREVVFEDLHLLGSKRSRQDIESRFVGQAERSIVEVGSANRGQVAVNHHHLAME